MNKEELKQYIDDNIYENPDGEITGESLNAVLKAIVDDGGTEVEANPTGEATETLSTLKIGETIYTAPQGPQGEPGEDGQDGQPGAPGPANTLTIGTVTDGEQAAASITGDAPNQQLNLVLPKGEQGDPGQNAVNPFKGWFDADITGEAGSRVTDDTANLPANPVVGDYAYVKTLDISGTAPSQTETPIVKIYECSTAGTWSDSGRTADTSNVQTFASGEEVNEVHIVNDLNTGGIADVLSAEQGKDLNEKIEEIYKVEEVIPETEVITFNSGGAATFDTIELSQNGDYLEMEIVCSTGLSDSKEWRAFMTYRDENNSRDTAISISYRLVGILNAARNWLSGMNVVNGQLPIDSYGDLLTKGKLKIAYENDEINVYLRSTLIHTVSTQSVIKINGAGEFMSMYWRGTLYSFKYHHGNVTINKLSELPGFTYNEYITIDPDSTQHEYVESGRLVDLEERVDTLESAIVEHPVEYIPTEVTTVADITSATFGENGYIQSAYFTASGLFQDSQYDTYWLISGKDMDVWVDNKGGSSLFRLLVANGTIDNYTNTYYSTTPPTNEENAVTVNEGQLFAICLNHGVTNFKIKSKFTEQLKIIDGYVIPDLENIKNRVSVIEENVGLPLRIEKTGEKAFSIYSTNKQGATLRYTWYRNQYTRPIGENGADIVCGDVWNQEQIKIASGYNIIQGNSNFVFSVDGTKSGVDGDHSAFTNESKDYNVGPGHGCEVAIYTIFLADGKKINPTELTEPLYCNVFKEICLSNCYAVDSTYSSTGNENNYPKLDSNYNPIIAATHYMEWELSEDNIIHEYNRLIAKRNGTVFGALYAAMLQCYVPYFKDVIINDIDGSWVEVGEPSAGSPNYISHSAINGTDFIWNVLKAYRATAISNNHNVSVTQVIQPLDSNKLGKLNIYTAPYADRFKCYFQPAITTLVGASNFETFNNGDKFEILVDRKIDISKDE